ncbi:MAG TPA: vitamin K epoxide reductase family protein [Pyrinomonadaceae bacterium]|nr:vitamin K epoxide reductase family protein [Pyrinomonadaceae bacterium]
MSAAGRESAAGAGGRARETTTSSPPQRISRLYSLAAVLSLAGLADAVYLTVEHLTGRSVRCSVTSGCSEVLASAYATIGGYPLALFGALAYFTAFSLATLAAFGSRGAGSLFAVLVALMFATSLWLLYLQAFVLRAFCQYCLLSAAITTLLACIVVARRVTK